MNGGRRNKIEVNIYDGGMASFAEGNSLINAVQNNVNKSNQIVKSRTQEYVDKWNENMFLNDFDKRDENAGVNIKLSEVYLEEHLPNYIWKDNKNTRNDLKNLLWEYVYEKNGNRMLLVLGQPGIGKSTLITWIVANFHEKRDDFLVYKFATDLKNIYLKRKDADYDIISGLLKKLNLSFGDLYGKIIILDGFDELEVGNMRAKILNQLYWKLIKEGLLNDFCLIISCRENYIQGLDAIGCDYITLQPWNREQIESFCFIYQQKINNQISKNTLVNIIKNRNVLGIPLILYMVLALEIPIENDKSIVDVYDQIFSLNGGIYDRCIENSRYECSHRINEIKGYIHQISREIALWIFENNSDEEFIPRLEYIKICDRVVRKQYKEDVKDDFLIGNFFKLIKHCEGIDLEKLYFVHRSIYEYFVAEYIFTSIYDVECISKEKLAGILGNLLKGNRLSKEICGYLEYKFRKDGKYNLMSKVNETFQLMLRDGMTYYTKKYFKNIIICELNVFYNMLEIIHMWKSNQLQIDNSICKYLNSNKNFKANLSGMNLSGVDLTNADLSYADLSGVNLNKAKLENANLFGAKLYEASLMNTNLNGANLTEARLMGANLEDAEFKDACLRGTVFSGIQIDYLGEKYDIRRDRATTKETITLLEELKEGINEKKEQILSSKEIDALLQSLVSEEVSVIDDEKLYEERVEIENRDNPVLSQKEIDALIVGLKYNMQIS